MSNTVDVGEFLVGYVSETDEHLSGAQAQIVALETARRRGEPHPRAVRDLYRALHTIKGLSGMVGADTVAEVAHAMETPLRACDRTGGVLSARAIELLGDGLSALQEQVRAFAASRPLPPLDRALVDELGAIEIGAGAASEGPRLTLDAELEGKLSVPERQQLALALRAGRRAVRIDFVPSPERSAAGVNITAVRERIGAIADIVRVVPLSRQESPTAPGGLLFAIVVATDASDERLAEAAATTVDAAVAVQLQELPRESGGPPVDGDETESMRSGVVRVPVARLDDALDKLSALVVSRYRMVRAVSSLAAAGADVRAVQEILSESGRQLRDLRAAILRARTVAAADMLDRVPLLVRGLARTTRKHARLEVHAGRAELDKAVAERLFPAIVHLVRNAMDHGIESPDDRRRAGKLEEGVIVVTCTALANEQLELTIEDDGRGIDGAALAARTGRAAPENDDELLELLATPGVSSREHADTTSGRGLGVDIARRITVGELGGSLRVRTEPGRGTAFTMRVPVTITIVDAFSFLCGGQQFVVPVAAVEEIVEVEASTAVPAPASASARALRLVQRRGETVPLARLAGLLDLTAVGGAWSKAIVVRRSGQPYAFEVDRLLGKQEVVVRPLDDALVRVPGVTGAVDLGDGKPTLMLDLVALSARLTARPGASA